jgi:hypothetical protein
MSDKRVSEVPSGAAFESDPEGALVISLRNVYY